MIELFKHELVYSGIARHIESLNLVSKSKILAELFGSRSATAIHDLPVNLRYFCGHNFPGGDYPPDFLIDNHTIFPYYIPFVSPNILSKVRESMMERGIGVKSSLGENRRILKRKIHFYYCPMCVIENRRQLGETYWHRLFQVQCVYICPIHHVWLKQTNILTTNLIKQDYFTPAERLSFETDVREYIDELIVEKFLFEYSRDILWLLEYQDPGQTLNLYSLKRKLYAALSRAGFASNNTIYIKKLASEFVKFFSMEVLNSFSVIDPSIFLRNLVNPAAGSKNPVHYYLLIHFLNFKAF